MVIKKKNVIQKIAKPNVVHVSGKRKKARARATLKHGKGRIRINSMDFKFYKPELGKAKIMEPLYLAGDKAKKIDISVDVSGGGWSAQTEAIRLAIAKGIVQLTKDEKLKQDFLDYDRGLLVADVRMNEPHKPNVSKPRKKRQKSYR